MTATTPIRLPIATPTTFRFDPALVVKTTARAVARNAVAIAFFILASGVFAVRSIYAHVQYRTNAFDLGIFGQGLKGYAEGHGPISAIKGDGYSLLGDHFSPINALLAPVYLVVPSIIVLLVAQAVLIALGSVPLIAWARRTLGVWPSIAVGLIFTTSFGVAAAVGFDFHEVAWAVPMLSISLSALGQQRYRTAALAALPLVLVKEDLGITVAAVGLVLVLRRRRALGAAVGAFGILASALEVLVLIPLANSSGRYDYSSQAASFNLASLWHQDPTTTDLKVTTVALTFSVGLFLAARSAMILVALPTILWRLVGTNSGYWTMNYQYSLVIMVVLVAGMIEVLARERRRSAERSAPFIRWALVGSIILNLVMAPNFPLGEMLRASFWHEDPRVNAMREAVALIPAGSTVSATNNLVPHLVDRSTVTVFVARSQDLPGGGGVKVRAPLDGPHPQWIVADLASAWPESPQERASALWDAQQADYREYWRKDDILVLKRTD